MGERDLDSFQIGKNICVIELEVIDNGDLGQVVHELAALVEKGGVVLITLNNEPVALGEAGALAQIIRNPADEIARVEAIVFKYPSKQGSRGRLAMRPRHHQGTFATNKKMLQQLRQGTVRE